MTLVLYRFVYGLGHLRSDSVNVLYDKAPVQGGALQEEFFSFSLTLEREREASDGEISAKHGRRES